MDVWDIISREVFASLIKDVTEKSSSIQDGVGDVDSVVRTKDNDEEEDPGNILNVLPMEILNKILCLLPNSDLYTLRLVSHKMKAAASTPQVLKLEFCQYKEVETFEAPISETLLGNIISMTIYNLNCYSSDNYEEDTTPAKVIRIIDQHCTSLQNLSVHQAVFPSTFKMDIEACNLSERLTNLDFTFVTFKNFANFLPATFPKLTYFHMHSCVFEGENPFDNLPPMQMKNLCILNVRFIDDFGDREFQKLMQDNLLKLTELFLIGLKMNGQDFNKLKLINLKKMNIMTCEFNDDWISNQLKNLRQLEVLELNGVSLKGTCSRDAFRHLNQLERLEISFCDLSNRSVSAMARYLPNLKSWELKPNEDGLITDEAFTGLILHSHLEVIQFERMQLSDTTLKQLVILTPHLKELFLSVCTCRDDTAVLVGKLEYLVKLSLQGTRITDVGLAALESLFGKLEEFTIDSRLVTVEGLQRTVPLLTAITSLNINFGEPECQLQHYGGNQDNYFGNLTMKGLPSALMLLSMERFHGVRNITFENVTISEQEVNCMSLHFPCIESFMVTQCEFTMEVAASLGKLLNNVKYVFVFRSRIPEAVILRLLSSVMDASKMNTTNTLEQISIENEPFLNAESLSLVISLITDCIVLDICCHDNEKSIKVNNANDYKEITINGAQQLGDNDIIAVVTHFVESTILTLNDVTLTRDGVVAIAPFCTKLTSLTLKTRTLEDNAMSVIGCDFQCSLTNIYLECERLTDEGLEALGKHLATVTFLSIKRTNITDDGIRRIAPKLTTINYLDIYENIRVTRELHEYMKATYPDIQHGEFIEVEAGEVPNGGNGEDGQAVNAELLEVGEQPPIGNDIVGEDVNAVAPDELIADVVGDYQVDLQIENLPEEREAIT